jgi:hypothetical protein
MPAYETITPIRTLYPGQAGYAFGYVNPLNPQGTAVVAEAITTTGKSIAFAVPASFPFSKGDTVAWSISFPTGSPTFTALLEGAITNTDSAYTTVDTWGATTTAQSKTGAGAYNFFRINVSAFSGAGTVIATISIS